MRKDVEETVIVTVALCDVCGKKATPYSVRVHKCHICKKDVCAECSIVTDHNYLVDGEFMGDYPDHYCKECWAKGTDIREAIFACRKAESDLWDEWHKGDGN